MAFTISIIGLGLMGASLAGALKGFRSAHLLGADSDAATREAAVQQGLVAACFPDAATAAKQADLLIFCVYAHQVPALLQSCLPHLKPGVLISDICGVKTPLYDAILPLLPAGIPYTGVHPMAGRERDGIQNADSALYKGSGFLICPTPASTPESIALLQEMAQHLGCARIEVVPYPKHDEIIAYTSDLMHISAAGLCLHYHPDMSLTFAAGAFRDCTRIADINATAWAELLLDNRPNVLTQLDGYLEALHSMRRAIEENDTPALQSLLARAGDNKREMLRR